ncbi:MAG: ABC transporter permease subunit [Gammaproteobacteria bacterium]|nr:ABC transporter permease subunit [Gammaproteobacteria bacterium]MYC58789.1 ABC transporter permease subunit [Gammaproteobacteria bacterium]MYH47282.1 ABC transporter permease subunit [Gammaproteobacteria bacterium]MYL13702.1 ABC transporter permease subunit [Gammaproteobacteria bacterium]
MSGVAHDSSGRAAGKPTLAERWYVPAEISALRVWLPFAALVNVLILGGEALRGNAAGMSGTLTAIVLLNSLYVALQNDARRWRRTASRIFATVALIHGALFPLWRDISLYDLWAVSWLVVPAGLSLYWLSTGLSGAWCAGASDARAAELGLARNRRLAPKLEAFGLHVFLLHAVALVVAPVVWIVDVSISPGNILGGAIFDAFSLEHFYAVLGGEAFWLWTSNSLVVALGTTLVGLLLAIPAGYAFSRYQFAGRKGAMFVFMLIQMFPGIIILVPYFMVMKTLGLLNTSIGLIVAYSVTALPLCVWMLKGFFDAVPRALEEAALLDGCNRVEVFFFVVLPLSLPAVAITALFSFLTAWNEFLLALVFNTSNDAYTLPVGLASMIPATNQLWGDFAAASIVVSIPVVVLFVLFQRSLIQGMSAGSVKG